MPLCRNGVYRYTLARKNVPWQMEQMSWRGLVVLGHFVTPYSNVTIDVNHRFILADSSSGDRTLFFLTGSAISFSNGWFRRNSVDRGSMEEIGRSWIKEYSRIFVSRLWYQFLSTNLFSTRKKEDFYFIILHWLKILSLSNGYRSQAINLYKPRPRGRRISRPLEKSGICGISRKRIHRVRGIQRGLRSSLAVDHWNVYPGDRWPVPAPLGRTQSRFEISKTVHSQFPWGRAGVWPPLDFQLPSFEIKDSPTPIPPREGSSPSRRRTPRARSRSCFPANHSK